MSLIHQPGRQPSGGAPAGKGMVDLEQFLTALQMLQRVAIEDRRKLKTHFDLLCQNNYKVRERLAAERKKRLEVEKDRDYWNDLACKRTFHLGKALDALYADYCDKSIADPLTYSEWLDKHYPGALA